MFEYRVRNMIFDETAPAGNRVKMFYFTGFDNNHEPMWTWSATLAKVFQTKEAASKICMQIPIENVGEVTIDTSIV